MTSPAPGSPHAVSATGNGGTSPRAATETSGGRTVVGLVAVTAAGRAGAAELATAWPGETRTYTGPAADALPRAFTECDAVVAFLATGAAVRLLAPHIGDKCSDPGAVCVDEARRFAVALLGGHEGGANELARRVAAVLGCEPVVTTASEAAGVPALNQLAEIMSWRVEPGSDVAGVGAAILSGQPVTLVTDRTWPLPALPDNVQQASEPMPQRPALVVTDRVPALPGDRAHTDHVKTVAAQASDPARSVDSPGAGADLRTAGESTPPHPPAVIYRPPTLAVGVGAAREAPAGEIVQLIGQALAEAGLSRLSVRHLATIDVKAGEAGIVDAAAELGVPLVTYPPEALAGVCVPNPSELVRAEVGTPSVAEAAALHRASGPTQRPHAGDHPAAADLVVPKRKSANATVAVARHPPRGRLVLVGLGPGSRDLLTPRAAAELRRASTVVGLDQYVEHVRDLLRPGTRVLSSRLGDEEKRARSAAEEAARGQAVALIGSGDAGVYAMASPVLDQVAADVEVVGVPGVTAALAASNLLGAPLGHDHAVISLSDLHTPWPAIEARVRAAAEADLVVAFYNPRSRARDWQLVEALRILSGHRPPGTPVGYVRAATRPGQTVTLTTLEAADPRDADMVTLVIVGSSATRITAGRMVTPRGYAWSGDPAGDTSVPTGSHGERP